MTFSWWNWPWWRVVWDFASHNNTSQKSWPWWRAVWDFTSHNNTSQKNWPWWRAVWDFTSHNNTSQKNWPWWRAVCDFTLHSNTSQKNWPAWLLSSRVAMCRFATGCCKTHWNGCMNVAWAFVLGRKPGARNLVFFRVKWLQPAMKGTSCVRRLRLRSVCLFFLPHCNGGFKLLWLCLCVRSYREFWNLWLQIALEWAAWMLHGLRFGEESRSKKPCIFPCKVAAAGACRNTFQYYRILQSLHKHVPVLPYTTKLAETRSSTTVYYKACTKSFQYYRILQSLQKHVPVLPYTTKLAQTRSSTTVYYKACTNTFQYYRILQSLHKVVPVLPYTTELAETCSSTTVYYKACTKSFPVLPYTTKLAETRSSTTVYYKACTNTFQYYRILQSLTKTVQYYRIPQSLQKHVPVLPYTTKLAQSRSSTVCGWLAGWRILSYCPAGCYLSSPVAELHTSREAIAATRYKGIMLSSFARFWTCLVMNLEGIVQHSFACFNRRLESVLCACGSFRWNKYIILKAMARHRAGQFPWSLWCWLVGKLFRWLGQFGLRRRRAAGQRLLLE